MDLLSPVSFRRREARARALAARAATVIRPFMCLTWHQGGRPDDSPLAEDESHRLAIECSVGSLFIAIMMNDGFASSA